MTQLRRFGRAGLSGSIAAEVARRRQGANSRFGWHIGHCRTSHEPSAVDEKNRPAWLFDQPDPGAGVHHSTRHQQARRLQDDIRRHAKPGERVVNLVAHGIVLRRKRYALVIENLLKDRALADRLVGREYDGNGRHRLQRFDRDRRTHERKLHDTDVELPHQDQAAICRDGRLQMKTLTSAGWTGIC